MFDIGFSELVLVFIIGLVVLGPQRLPVAVKTVMGWIRAMRSLASSVQNELAQELKLQELQDSLRKVEQASKDSLPPELKASMDELKHVADELKRGYQGENEKADDEAHTIHNPLIQAAKPSHDSATPVPEHQVSAVPDAISRPVDTTKQAADSVVKPAEAASPVVVSAGNPVPTSQSSDKT